MKTIFSVLIFVGLALTSFSQSTPYVEFTETNSLNNDQILHIPAGGFIWFYTDNTDPSDIKTYVRSSRVTPVDIAPITPPGWNAFKMYYDVDTDFSLPVSGPTDYMLDNNFSPCVQIN